MAAKVERFEDLHAWQRAMDLAVHAYELARMPKFARDYALIDQIHRAAASVPANIAEGFDRGTRPEFHRFLSIAKGSCAELRSHFHLANRVGYLDRRTTDIAVGITEEVSRLLGKLRRTVATHRAQSRT